MVSRRGIGNVRREGAGPTAKESGGTFGSSGLGQVIPDQGFERLSRFLGLAQQGEIDLFGKVERQLMARV